MTSETHQNWCFSINFNHREFLKESVRRSVVSIPHIISRLPGKLF